MQSYAAEAQDHETGPGGRASFGKLGDKNMSQKQETQTVILIKPSTEWTTSLIVI